MKGLLFVLFLLLGLLFVASKYDSGNGLQEGLQGGLQEGGSVLTPLVPDTTLALQKVGEWAKMLA